MEHGFSQLSAGIRLNNAYLFFLLAEKYGWTHREILGLSRPEALYYLLAPVAYEKQLRRKQRK
ncbi:MAG: hypothetical protein RMI43_05350 [Candidatus Caldarchaeum sp.]|nr:hypothetical protein [Candidatus Caldarchaeum sp.]MCX8200811.1 hypothetical protein [Candidatus Caldarchaeum sp.]MDW8063576.1 hypothetical protein [Candidatus Caldarchaeum sp.]MDW8434793.1 hypothetical protein [Candidatus Caldarchaeum sp.]